MREKRFRPKYAEVQTVAHQRVLGFSATEGNAIDGAVAHGFTEIPITDVAAAHPLLDSGETVGKVLLTIREH